MLNGEEFNKCKEIIEKRLSLESSSVKPKGIDHLVKVFPNALFKFDRVIKKPLKSKPIRSIKPTTGIKQNSKIVILPKIKKSEQHGKQTNKENDIFCVKLNRIGQTSSLETAYSRSWLESRQFWSDTSKPFVISSKSDSYLPYDYYACDKVCSCESGKLAVCSQPLTLSDLRTNWRFRTSVELKNDAARRTARLTKSVPARPSRIQKRSPAFTRFRAVARAIWNIIRLFAITSRNLKTMEENLDYQVKDQANVICFDLQSFKSASTSVNGLSKRAKEATRKSPEERTSADIQCLLEIVSRMPLFAEYRKSVQQAVAAILQYDPLGAGRVVVKQGDVGTRVYFVVSGRLGCYMTETDPKTGHSTVQHIKDYTVGTVFGNLFMEEPLKRHATLVCREESELLSVCKLEVAKILRKDKEDRCEYHYRFLKSTQYFSSWIDEQIRGCADEVSVKEYEDKEVIMCETKKSPDILHIIESGKCQLIKSLVLIEQISPYQSVQYILPEMTSQKKFMKKKYGKHLRRHDAEKHYLRLMTLGPGDFFNAGEKMENLYIIAEGKVTCMRVHHELFEINLKKHELTKMSEKRDMQIPDKEELFNLYVINKNWDRYKEKLIDEIKKKKHLPTLCSKDDVPKSIISEIKPVFSLPSECITPQLPKIIC